MSERIPLTFDEGENREIPIVQAEFSAEKPDIRNTDQALNLSASEEEIAGAKETREQQRQKALQKARAELGAKPSKSALEEHDTGPSSGQPETKENIKAEHSYSDLLSELDRASFDIERISDICTQENLIGHGGNADVYKIPGAKKYVLRVSRAVEKPVIAGTLKEVQDIFPEFNVGQAVAEIAEDGIQFLRMQKGIPAGVPHGETRKTAESADPIYAEHLKRAAEMPQSAYDEFARMLQIINERDHQFDPSKANNVLVDVESGKFNLVDVNKRSKGSTYKNSMSDMVITLMDNSYAWRYKGKEALETYRRIILDKCIEAGRKIGWQVPILGKNSSMDYSFALAGLKRDVATEGE